MPINIENKRRITKKWFQTHKEHRRKYMQNYKKTHPLTEEQKEKHRQYCREYQQRPEVKEKRKVRNRLYQRKLAKKYKHIVFNHYGYKCVCCGEINPKFLTIDHVNGLNGRKRKSHLKLWRQIINENFPDTYQVLCFNCNIAKGLYGVCPHNEKY